MSGGEIERPDAAARRVTGWGNRIDGLPTSQQCRFPRALKPEFSSSTLHEETGPKDVSIR